MSWYENILRRVCVRVPALKEDEDMAYDLIKTAFDDVMNYTRADKYDKSWDSILIKLVILLYNVSGVEGSIVRENGGISDEYESSNIVAVTLSGSNLPHYIRPTGHSFENSRMDFPE